MTSDLDRADIEQAIRLYQPQERRYRRPGALAAALDPASRTSKALDLIDQALVDLEESREVDALAIFLPPQEGKSQRASRRYPEWLLDNDPALRIALVSYELDTALRWGRDVKQDVALAEEDRLRIAIRQDSSAAGRWETLAGGGMYCVGIGGPLTGRPVDRLIVDDPVKDRAAAESARIRDLTWDWWESVALTRLAPGAKVVLIQCMTGDTPVLMGDGTEKRLADIRPGDTVATYERGEVTTSAVRNWACQGPDRIYTIRMRSGRTVRANARHPFLTVDARGAESWQRTDLLRPGSRIRLVTGASGGASSAPSATGQRGAQAVTARDCACRTTTSSDGRGEFARRLSTRRQAGQRTSATAMASTWRSMTGSLRSRAASALSAPTPLAVADQSLTTRAFASITTTRPGASGDCCAIAATLPLDTSGHRRPCSRQLSTYSVSCDEVAEVIPAGFEDVFDIEVERTHTFIANGLTTHNTRWHEDDLAGRIFARPSPLRWRVLSIPAIAVEGDPLGRAPGEELVSVRRREPGYFRRLAATMSRYVFSGVYQQNPTAPEGNFFRRATFRYWRPLPPWPDGRERIDLEGIPVTLADSWRFLTIDPAASTKTSADYTVISCWAQSLDGHLILLDRARARVPDHDHFTLAEPLARRWGASQMYIEKSWWAATFVTDAKAAGYPVAPLEADTDKVTRAIPAAGRVSAGRVWFPAETSGCSCGGPCSEEGGSWLGEWCDELAAFPRGAHDDQVDTFSYAARVVSAEWVPPGRQPPLPGLTGEERALIEEAHRAATGDGQAGGLDIMSVPY
jgi:predicted phage terminase large subunit-like protein